MENELQEMEQSNWRAIKSSVSSSAHYSIAEIKDSNLGMQGLRDMFLNGEADHLNFVLFSTSGVHGSYLTIEECEEHNLRPENQDNQDYYYLTFLIVHPRLVAIRYGTCIPITLDDFAFLKKLRETSYRVVTQIGKGE
jgi:hypothetical protein